jgi:hypothetical protein
VIAAPHKVKALVMSFEFGCVLSLFCYNYPANLQIKQDLYINKITIGSTLFHFHSCKSSFYIIELHDGVCGSCYSLHLHPDHDATPLVVFVSDRITTSIKS